MFKYGMRRRKSIEIMCWFFIDIAMLTFIYIHYIYIIYISIIAVGNQINAQKLKILTFVIPICFYDHQDKLR